MESEPIVQLLSKPQFDVEAFLVFLASENGLSPPPGDQGKVEPSQLTFWQRSDEASEAEELIEAAGRICYMSFGKRQSPKSNAEYIRHLIRSGHGSVLEHVNWTFLITNVSRACTHQLVRHRVGFSFSQMSQQYCDETDAEFVMPPQLRDHPAARKAWNAAVESSQQAYREILRSVGNQSKSDRESLRELRSVARSVLPNATESKIIVTANARSLRHFLSLRGTVIGDLEMRLLSTSLFRIVQPLAPAVFFDFEEAIANDGYPLLKCNTE